MINTIKELNYTNVRQIPVNTIVPVIPWGSIEPHGEHLSYLTDTLLAEAVATESVNKANDNECYQHFVNFIVMPPFSMGSQNPGQTDKMLCIHFNVETQKAVLTDIVNGLWTQGITSMVIVNGHNGNNFKCIVRDLENKYPEFTIYVCNYLDILSVYSKGVDDHAGFTETSLMMYCYPEFVEIKNVLSDSVTNGASRYNEEKTHHLWTPRDWNLYSYETRIGYVEGSSPEQGQGMFEYTTNKLAFLLNEEFNGSLMPE